MIIMEGQGVGGQVGDESSPSLFFFFTMVSNGVDTMRILCSFKVRVMRRAIPYSKFFYDGFKWCRRNAIPVQCSDCQSGSKQARVNGRSYRDPFECGVLCPLSSCSLVSLMCYMYIYKYIYL